MKTSVREFIIFKGGQSVAPVQRGKDGTSQMICVLSTGVIGEKSLLRAQSLAAKTFLSGRALPVNREWSLPKTTFDGGFR